jgi:hypothetical protein
MSCPACKNKRQHATEDWVNHPLAGHGFAPELGWTCPEAEQAHNEGATTVKK